MIIITLIISILALGISIYALVQLRKITHYKGKRILKVTKL